MRKYWFKKKSSSWSWSPASWQGWLVMGIFFILVSANVFRMEFNALSRDNAVLEFVLETIAMALALVVICYKTGEKQEWQ